MWTVGVLTVGVVMPKRIEGGLYHYLRTCDSPVGPKGMPDFLVDSKLRCPQCQQFDVQSAWGCEIEIDSGCFEMISTCLICRKSWVSMYANKKALEKMLAGGHA